MRRLRARGLTWTPALGRRRGTAGVPLWVPAGSLLTVIGRPVAAYGGSVTPRSEPKARPGDWKAGGPQGWLAEIRRDGAPAGASPLRKRTPAERQHPRRSADRRSVPFGLAEGGKEKSAY